MCLYLLNASFHPVSFKGGKAPRIGFHSVMDSPEPVSLVIPPSNIWIINMARPISNQIATGREDGCKNFSCMVAAKVSVC